MYFIDNSWTNDNSKIELKKNRAFSYGDGLFETIKVANRKPYFLNYHFNRLKKGCEILKINFSWNDYEEFYGFIQHGCNSLPTSNGRIRLTYWRSSEGKYMPKSNDAEYILEFDEVNTIHHWHEHGIYLGSYVDAVKPNGVLSNIKSLNALFYVLASIELAKTDFHDLIIFNSKNRPIETTVSNLFVIKNNIIYTPSLSESCLEGVMRNVVIDTAKKMGLEVVEKSISYEELISSDEVFTTNVIKGIQWVSQINEVEIKSNHFTNMIFDEIVSYVK